MPRKKQPQYVFALRTTLVFAGGRFHIQAGQVWHADHPVVDAYPDLFSDEPPEILPRNWESPVEQATAAPGEKRATKRTTKRTAHNDDD